MIQTWEQYQYVHLALSRYSRLLAGEIVATPSTASSIQSPRSRHSTPVSARSTEEGTRGTPNSSLSRLMSPKFTVKTELTTVSEAKTPSGDNDVELLGSERVDDRSIFSPKSQKDSHFSFSRSDQNENFKPLPQNDIEAQSKDSSNLSIHDSTKAGSVREEDLRRKKVIPPQLALKIQMKPSLKRDENWLRNGHCDKEEEVVVQMSPMVDDANHCTESVDEKNNLDEDSIACRDSQATGAMTEQSKTNVNPEESCQTPSVSTKTSLFVFPSPEK